MKQKVFCFVQLVVSVCCVCLLISSCLIELGAVMSESEQKRSPREWCRQWSLKTKLTVLLAAILTVTGLSFLFYRWFVSTQQTEHRWDTLVFAQSWPLTACKAYVNNRAGCKLPSKSDFWTIHGIWPTKIGAQSPINCNSSNKLNLTEISSIQTELSEYWMNIKTNQPRESFWQHEWNKHGTCALDLPALDTQSKYFNKALEWVKVYNMKDILDKASIYPDSTKTLQVETVWLAVKKELDKNPFIQCAYDRTLKQHYLQEIRMCFDRDLDLADCVSNGNNKQKILGNCPRRKPIIYPSSVPSR